MSNKLLYTKSSKNIISNAFPQRQDGKNGDIRLINQSGNIFLAAKIKEDWYTTSSLKRFQDRNILDFHTIRAENVEVSKLLIDDNNGANWYIDSDGVIYCDSIKFNSGGSKTIDSTASEGNGGATKISGQGTTSTSGSAKGGNVFISAGSAPTGTHGVTVLNHNGSSAKGSFVDIWSDVRIHEGKKLIFDGDEDTTGLLDESSHSHTYIYESSNDVLKIVVGSDDMVVIDEGNNLSTFQGTIYSGVGFATNSGRFLTFDKDADSHTTIGEVSADAIGFTAGGENLLLIQEDATTSAAQSSYVRTYCPLQLKDIGNADTPASGYGNLYVKADELNFKNDSGTITNLTTPSAETSVKIVSVTITEGEMNALHTTEKVILAAQGLNKVIIPISCTAFVDRDASTAQSTNASMWISTDGTYNLGWGFFKRFMRNETGDRVLTWAPVEPGENSQDLIEHVNKPLTAAIDMAITSGSIDSCKLVIAYHVYDVS